MNTFVVGIGTNCNRAENIGKAVGLLRKAEWTEGLRFSSIVQTEPVGLSCPDFLNCICVFSSEKDEIFIIGQLKNMEKIIGRNPDDKKKGIVRIDIDLLKRNDTVLKKEYHYPFMQKLLAELF